MKTPGFLLTLSLALLAQPVIGAEAAVPAAEEVQAAGESALPEGAQSPVDAWQSLLRPHYFKDVPIVEDTTVIDLSTPYRAEDAALTPVSISAKFPQTPERYIRTLYLFADKNPEPLAGVFHLTPELGRADLHLRIRINEYTHVRAIAVLNTGEHHMVTKYVKASGGCSAPLGADLKAAMARIGKMRLRTVEQPADGPLLAQFAVSHPNITGMQMDQKTRTITPPHYVKSLRISLDGRPVMTAETGISISADPSFRFYLDTEPGAEVTAEVVDSENRAFTESFTL
jgi:sulfur-oxidizing protein SoxY